MALATWRGLWTALTAATLAAGPASAVADEPVQVRVEPWQIDRPAPFPLTRVQALRLIGPDDFGGLSGLVWRQGRSALQFVSDDGWLYTATASQTDEGVVTNLEGWSRSRLPSEGTSTRWRDAEAIARFDEGLLVGFEKRHRVERYRDTGAAVEPLEVLHLPKEAFARLNNSVEALVDLPGGGWLALTEETKAGLGVAFIDRGEGLRQRGYRTVENLVPTGADRVGEAIVVVERSFDLGGFWRARLVCFHIDELKGDSAIEPREIARLEFADSIDNLEGVAARRLGDAVDLLLVSDNNFFWLQNSLVLQYRVAVSALIERGCDPGSEHQAVRNQHGERDQRLDREIADRPRHPG